MASFAFSFLLFLSLVFVPVAVETSFCLFLYFLFSLFASTYFVCAAIVFSPCPLAGKYLLVIYFQSSLVFLVLLLTSSLVFCLSRLSKFGVPKCYSYLCSACLKSLDFNSYVYGTLKKFIYHFTKSNITISFIKVFHESQQHAFFYWKFKQKFGSKTDFQSRTTLWWSLKLINVMGL